MQLAIANQKGGVGKTTTAVNLAASLVYRGQKVLVVDLDPQGNATTGSGVNKGGIKAGTYQVLTEQIAVTEAILPTKAGFMLMPANRSLAGAEVELVQELARETRLRQALASIEDKYDFVLIDCPPTLTLLTLNGLIAADGILVPMVCEYYALEGVSDLIATVRRIRQSGLNPTLDIFGVLRTMFDVRNNLAQEVAQQLKDYFKNKVFQIDIPRNVRLAEAPSHGLPALLYDPKARGSEAYVLLADEVIERVKHQ